MRWFVEVGLAVAVAGRRRRGPGREGDRVLPVRESGAGRAVGQRWRDGGGRTAVGRWRDGGGTAVGRWRYGAAAGQRWRRTPVPE